MLPTTVALVSATFTGRQRGTALGSMGGIAAVAGAAGPVIGGLLTATVGWQAVFLINVPLAAIAVAITLTAIPSDIHQANTAKIDVPGAVLLAVGITALISITRHLASGNFTLVSCISCSTNITMAIYGPPYSQLQQKSLHGTASIS